MKNALKRFYHLHLMKTLAATTVVCGLIGSYIYYRDQANTGGVRLMMVTIFSTVRLYMALPTVELVQETNIFYEISRFLAPIYTATAIVQLMKKTFMNALNEFRSRWKKEQILIFGYNEKSLSFLDTLHQQANQRRRSLVFLSDTQLDDDIYLNILAKGAVTKILGLSNSNHYDEAKSLFQKLRVGEKTTVILMSEDKVKNFHFVLVLKDYLSGKEEKMRRPAKRRVQCRIMSEDCGMNEIFEGIETECPELLDVSTFHLSSIVVDELFCRLKLYDAKRDGAETDIHLLLLGFGSIGQELVVQTINSAVVTASNTILIDIFDQDMAQLKELFLHRFSPEMVFLDYAQGGSYTYTIGDVDRDDSLLKLRFHSADIRSIEFERSLLSIQKDSLPFTYAAICVNNEEVEITGMITLRKYISAGTPIAMRTTNSEQLLFYLNKEYGEYDNIVAFGSNQEVLTYERIIEDEQWQKASEAHKRYNLICEKVTNRKQQTSWENLSAFAKKSNYQQAVHEAVKRDFLEHFSKSKDFYGAMGEFRLKHGDAEQESFQKSSDLLMELAEIEHRRWCYFMITNGFRRMPEIEFETALGDYLQNRLNRTKTKGDFREAYRVHSALSRWEELQSSSSLSSTVLYDLIPWLLISPE